MAKSLKPRPTHASLAAKARGRQKSPRWPWVVGGLILLVVIVGGIFLWRANNTPPVTTASGAPIIDNHGEIVGLQKFPNQARDHQIGPLSFAQTPPVGGIHNPVWQNCGIYGDPIPNENAVHSLEHGSVWITYQPTLAAADVETLRALVRGHSHALLSPYPNLPAPVVISAWGLQVQVQSAADPRLALFIKTYENGPQTPEPGATCSGGTGTPLQS
ncbi:MAG: DUF3105 domain-containing protein [Chloroflexi bacterium]|nr:DUF3105 domain-containing protein [Chloroflexota bacterium]